MKFTPKIYGVPLGFLELVSKFIAFVVCVGLLVASFFIVVGSFKSLLAGHIDLAVQDGLFVLILLEMFYVVRSFIQYGSINVSLVISVGIIAAVKEMIFQLPSITLQAALGFGVIFLTLALTYFLEKTYYEKMIKENQSTNGF